MIRALRILLALAALIVIVAFAIANRTPVAVSLAPLPIVTELPVYGVFLLGLVLGGLIGGLAVWLSNIPARREARRMRNKVWALENQIAVLKKQEQRAHAENYSAQREVMAASTSGQSGFCSACRRARVRPASTPADPSAIDSTLTAGRSFLERGQVRSAPPMRARRAVLPARAGHFGSTKVEVEA